MGNLLEKLGSIVVDAGKNKKQGSSKETPTVTLGASSGNESQQISDPEGALKQLAHNELIAGNDPDQKRSLFISI